MRTDQGGFTLIELVVVITIIGILAATALPRFVDLEGEAHKSAVQGAKAGLAAGVNLVHSKAVATGNTGGTVSFQDGESISVNDNGWPVGTDAPECQTVWQKVMKNPPTVAANDSNTDKDYNATGGDPCEYQYQADTNITAITYSNSNGAVSGP